MFSVYFSLAYQQSQNAAPAFTKTTVPVAFSVKQTQSQQPHQVNITSHGFVCVIWLMGVQGALLTSLIPTCIGVQLRGHW